MAETRRLFPDGCPLAMAQVRAALATLPDGRTLEVVVCAFSEADEAAYSTALEALTPE